MEWWIILILIIIVWFGFGTLSAGWWMAFITEKTKDIEPSVEVWRFFRAHTRLLFYCGILSFIACLLPIDKEEYVFKHGWKKWW